MTWLLLILMAFVAGSIPFGLIIGRFKGIDIREHGSKNIGATNVGRVLGQPYGGLCFLLDVAKGALPVIVAGQMNGIFGSPVEEISQTEMWLWMAVTAAAMLGHMFSPFVKFKGGKGVATGFGAMAAMWPLTTFPALGALAVWYALLRISKYVSLASMCAAASMPVFYVLAIIPPDGRNIGSVIAHGSPPLIVLALLALLVVYKHRANIARLRRGEEPKVGRRGET